MTLHIRPAVHGEQPVLKELIERSARELSRGDYTSEQIEGALRGAFGVDTQLIDDGTYFVAEIAGRIAGCGGWSYRRTLFGGDARRDRDAGQLDPRTDAAKIRAFFVDPAFARRGIGRAILRHCESAALQRGFRRFELMGTLPGVRLYRECGYIAGEPVQYAVGAGVSIQFVPMAKSVIKFTCLSHLR